MDAIDIVAAGDIKDDIKNALAHLRHAGIHPPVAAIFDGPLGVLTAHVIGTRREAISG